MADGTATASRDGRRQVRSSVARRRRWTWAAAGLAVLVALGTLVALRFVRSPEQALLDAAPPDRSVLTSEVVKTVVTDSLVGRGTVEAAAPVAVPLVAAADGARTLVSAAPRAVGDAVDAGDVVVVVSGRPVIALVGAVPAYRDLRPGDVGDDVRQLQEALAGLGLDVRADGTYGEQTKAAVRRLYSRAGYQVPSTTGLGEPTDPEVAAAEDAVRDASRRLEAAERAQQAGPDAQQAGPDEPGPGSEPDAGTLPDAVTVTETATPPETGTPPDTATPPETGTPLASNALPRTEGTSGTAAADDAASAREDLGRARTTLAEARARSGPVVPRGEVVFVASTPTRLVGLSAGVGDEPTDPVATLATGDLVVRARLDPGQAAGVRDGMAVTLVDEISGWTGSGAVAAVGQVARSDDGPSVDVTVVPDEPVPGSMVGTSLKVVVTETSSDGEVLAVPVAAVTAAADGTVYVVRVDGAGRQTKVVVVPGVDGGGLVEVVPVDGPLDAGDTVVTSR